MAAEKKRQLHYELLRIAAMLMIVSLHYLSKGGLLGDPARADMTAAGYTAWFVEAFFLVAVNVYVLISGYFGVDARGGMTNGKNVSFREVMRRPLRIWKQVLFYSVLFGCGAFVIGAREFDLYQLFSYCFPIVTEHYWFATSYVILCLAMPFLNAGIAYMDQRELKYLLCGFLLLFSVSKTVIPMQLPWDKYGYDSLWFVILYLTGAYLRHYEVTWIKTGWRAAMLYLGSMLTVFASFFLIRLVFFRTGRLEDLINYGYTYNFLFCYTGAVGLFLLFKEFGKQGRESGSGRMLERFRKPIELFSGATFGVYLIHEHIDVRSLWTVWVDSGTLIEGSVGNFLAHMIVTVLCVYLVCTAVELIRQRSGGILLPALILLVYPLRHAAVGLDLMDAGYALGNYRFFDALNEMWKLATYLSNITGVLLSKLPFGDRWIGMNVYSGLLIGAAAAGVYLFMQKRYGKKHKSLCALLFAAEITALSLCWAPGVILYHYLGYLLMTAAVLVLFTALTKEQEREKTTYFVAAGVILGLCVAVRMPNITYMALILPVWCDCFWNSGRAGRLGTLVKRTLCCAGGYLAGVAVPLAAICARYGVAAYPRMIASLFGMTDQATDYKPASMVTAMFGDYIRYSPWLLLFAGYMLIGMLFFRLADRAFCDKITCVFKTLYALGLLVVLRFCYGRGMFGFDYSDNFSMYKWVVVYLLIAICMCVRLLFRRRADRELRLWAVFLLVVIFVTPLGSNNGLYPIINNLFLVMPVSVLLFRDACACKGAALPKCAPKDGGMGSRGFAFRLVLGFVLACTAVQSALFGVRFVFHDAGAAGGKDSREISLLCSGAGAGIVTTADRKESLESLDRYLYQSGLNEKQVILYGGIPALAYLFDMEPAISTTWADLDSYAMAVFEQELDRVSGAEPDGLPVVILARTAVERTADEDSLERQKFARLLDFVGANGYRQCFENEAYIVLSAD